MGQKYYPKKTGGWIEKPDHPVFEKLRFWLRCYFSGENQELGIPLAPEGSPFQSAVWEMLVQIPYGELTTYGALAKRLAKKRGVAFMSAQAVGGAVGHNPISLLIPCHRVVGATGALTGYAGGIDKKKALLRLEGARIEP